jgi:ribonuclease PH
MNVVKTSSGLFIEVQGTAEGPPFPRDTLDGLLTLADRGIATLIGIQREVLNVSTSGRI